MKTLKTILIVTLVFVLASCSKNETLKKKNSCIPQGLVNNVVAFYPFSNGSLNDKSGFNKHLTNSTNASASFDRYGNASCAFEFHNFPTSSEFLSSSNTDYLRNLTDFSVSLWYQALDTTRLGSDYEGLVGVGVKPKCPDYIGEWSIGLYDCRRALFVKTQNVWDLQITNNSSCQAEITARTDSWVHLTATYKKSSNTMKIYRNGVLQSISDGTASHCGISSNPNLGDLIIGKDYTGKIDDVFILNKAVNQQDVNALFGMGTCCQ